MKKLDLTSLFDHLYIEVFATFFFILGFHIWYFFMICMIYIVLIFRHIHTLRLMILFFMICIGFYIVHVKSEVTLVDGEAKVVEMMTYDDYQKLTIRYHFIKYHVYSQGAIYKIGDVIYIKGEVINYRHQSVPYGFDFYEYYISNQIFGKIETNEIHLIKHHFGFYSLREKIKNHVSDTMVLSLIFNEKSSDDEIQNQFKSLDLLFLVQVSGIHLFIFVKMIKKILFYLDVSKQNTSLLITMFYLIVLYLSKFDLSVIRLSLAFVILQFDKTHELNMLSIDRLSLVFIIMICIDPHLYYSYSFLLMILILYSIELIGPLFNQERSLIRRYLISLLIMVVLLPFNNHLSLLYLLIAPLVMVMMSTIVYPLTWLVFIQPSIAVIYDPIMHMLNDLLNRLVSNNITISYHHLEWYEIICLYASLVFLIYSKTFISFVKRSFIYLLILMIPTLMYVGISQDALYMIDVGQGDGFLIKLDHQYIIVDCFKNTKNLVENLGIHHIDYLILTHSDEDHTLEAQDLIDHFDVSHIILNAYDRNYESYQGHISRIKAGDFIELENQTIHFYNPIRDYQDANNNSLVFKIHIGNYDFLMTGDIEKVAEEAMVEKYHYMLKSDVLKIAHHGSDTSSSLLFLKTVDPQIALISVGKNNQFGFPSNQTIQRLMDLNILIYRSDDDGTVIYKYQFNHQKWVTYL